MHYKNLMRSAARMASLFIPKHPLLTRGSWTDDDKFVAALTYDDTDFDVVPDVPYIPFSSYLRTGETPPRIGSMAHTSRLADVAFADNFVRAFNAASAPPSAPAAEPSAPAAESSAPAND